MSYLKERIDLFLLSLPKTSFPKGKHLYHGTNLEKIKINNCDKLFLSTNPTESIRHSLRKTNEQKKGAPYLHEYILNHEIRIISFTEFTRNLDLKKQYKWDVINQIVGTNIDNFQMELIFFELLKKHPEIDGYYDGCDQGVVVLRQPANHLDCINIKRVKSLKQNQHTIRIEHHTEQAYRLFDQYYHDLYINRLNPNPIHIHFG